MITVVVLTHERKPLPSFLERFRSAQVETPPPSLRILFEGKDTITPDGVRDLFGWDKDTVRDFPDLDNPNIVHFQEIAGRVATYTGGRGISSLEFPNARSLLLGELFKTLNQYGGDIGIGGWREAVGKLTPRQTDSFSLASP